MGNEESEALWRELITEERQSQWEWHQAYSEKTTFRKERKDSLTSEERGNHNVEDDSSIKEEAEGAHISLSCFQQIKILDAEGSFKNDVSGSWTFLTTAHLPNLLPLTSKI